MNIYHQPGCGHHPIIEWRQNIGWSDKSLKSTNALQKDTMISDMGMPLTRIMINRYMAMPARETIMREMRMLSQKGNPAFSMKLHVMKPVTTYNAPWAKLGSRLIP
jgi:hypothetical protein